MSKWKHSAEKQFDSWSKSYDRSILQRIFFGPSHDLICSKMEFVESAHILDVGCGTGVFARKMLEMDPTLRVTGLDISEGMINNAKKNCAEVIERVELVLGDGEHLPFEDNTFDALTCNHSFHHYPNKLESLKEMRRVLKPQGQLLLLDANRDNWWGWFVYDCIVKAIERNIHHCSAGELKTMLYRAGFENVKQYITGGITPFLLNCANPAKAASGAIDTSSDQAVGKAA